MASKRQLIGVALATAGLSLCVPSQAAAPEAAPAPATSTPAAPTTAAPTTAAPTTATPAPATPAAPSSAAVTPATSAPYPAAPSGSAAPPPPAPGATPASEMVARGKYLTDMGDCAACHTASQGAMFAGGRYMDTPFGALSTPNITPDKATGIGTWSDDDFYRLFHDGIAKNGEHIYPAMPYPWYRHVTRADTLAIKAYLFSLPPVHAPRKPSHMEFPFNIRAGLAVWDAFFLVGHPFQPNPKESAEINRGNYIVNGLEHCGECHNNNKLLGNVTWAGRLHGGVIDGWWAPNITSDKRYGIGRYTDDQIVQFLHSGVSGSMGVVLGPMSETVHESLSKMSDADLHAIVAYLKSTTPVSQYTDAKKADFTGQDPTGVEAYLTNCASCHQQNGEGKAGVIPALAGNPVVASGGPQSIIKVILGGVEAQKSYGPMYGLAENLGDVQIAQIANYVRQSWGNTAPATATAGMVGTLRKETHTMLGGDYSGGCPALAQQDVAKIVADPNSGVEQLLQGVNAGNVQQSSNEIVAKVRAADPKIERADLVNSLTIAYCPVVQADKSLNAEEKVWQLNLFGEQLYTQSSPAANHRTTD